MEPTSWAGAVAQVLGGVLSLGTVGAAALTSCIAGSTSGCESAPGFPKEIGRTVEKVGTSIADQALWEDITANIDGQVIEPGYEAFGGVKYYAGVKFTGFSGRAGLGAAGTGSGTLSPEARRAILSVDFQDERDKEWVLSILGLVRPDEPTNGTTPK